MRFEVSRTSGRATDGKPCEEAFPVHVPVWDQRTSKSPEQHDALMRERFVAHALPAPWLSEGTDHCVTDCGIARKLGSRPSWAVDFPDLDALVAFVARYGDVVIEPAFMDRPPRVEIYDDYRE